MSLIDILVFHLADGADETAFRAADEQLQIAVMLECPGLLRRTTARSESGNWLVLTQWASREAFENAPERLREQAAAAAFDGFVDESTRRAQQFETL